MDDIRRHPLWCAVFGAWFAGQVYDHGNRQGRGYSDELYDRVFEEAEAVADAAMDRLRKGAS